LVQGLSASSGDVRYDRIICRERIVATPEQKSKPRRLTTTSCTRKKAICVVLI